MSAAVRSVRPRKAARIVIPEIVFAILEIFGIFAVGWAVRRAGYLVEEDLDRWSKLVVDIFMPCLIFSSVVADFNITRLRELAILPALGLGMMVLGALAGIALRQGLRSRDPDLRKTFHHFCAINNYSFLPVIIVTNLWGRAALANLFFLNLGSSLGFWTVGVGLLGGGTSARQVCRNIFSFNLLALALALGLSVAGWNDAVPRIVLNITGSIGAAAVPCMLLLVGATMYSMPTMRDGRDLAWLSVVRLVIMPLVIILVIRALPAMPDDVRDLAIIVSLMPTAVSSTVVTRRFGGSPVFAVQAAVVTTLLSLVTIPLLLRFVI